MNKINESVPRDPIEALINIASRLGFTVNLNNSISWNFSKASFYPRKQIIIGTKNYSETPQNSIGNITKEAITLILSHEVGHVLVYKTKYPNVPLEEFCFNDNSELLIKQEIYAWKTALSEIELNENSLIQYEIAQEAINEYIYCEYIGTCSANQQIKVQQSLFDKISKFTGSESQK